MPSRKGPGPRLFSVQTSSTKQDRNTFFTIKNLQGTVDNLQSFSGIDDFTHLESQISDLSNAVSNIDNNGGTDHSGEIATINVKINDLSDAVYDLSSQFHNLDFSSINFTISNEMLVDLSNQIQSLSGSFDTFSNNWTSSEIAVRQYIDDEIDALEISLNNIQTNPLDTAELNKIKSDISLNIESISQLTVSFENIETTITNSVLSDLCANIITSLVTDVSNNKTVLNTLSGEFITFRANWTTSETALRNTLINDLSNVSDITNSTLNMGSNDVITTGKVLYSNMYQNEVDLPSATTYHGMFAHVHGTGKAYYAHNGNWISLANEADISFSGSYNDLTDKPVIPTVDDISQAIVTLSDSIVSLSEEIANMPSTITSADLDMGINDVITTGKVLYSNMYQNEVDLPSATTYHGMFAHVHGTGKAYYAHAGNWVALANESYATELFGNIQTRINTLDVNVNTLDENINTIDTTHTNNVNLITQDISNVRLDLSNVRLDLSNVVNMTDQISDISDLLHQFNTDLSYSTQILLKIDDLSSSVTNVINSTISFEQQIDDFSLNLYTRLDIIDDISLSVITLSGDVATLTDDISNINFLLLGDISTNLNTLSGNNVVDRIDISNLKYDVSNHYDHFTTITGDISSNLDGLVVQTTQGISSLNVLLSDHYNHFTTITSDINVQLSDLSNSRLVLIETDISNHYDHFTTITNDISINLNNLNVQLSDLSDSRLVLIETDISTNNNIISDLSDVTYAFITDASANMNVLSSQITDLSANSHFDISAIQHDISDRIDVSLNDISTFIQDLSASTNSTFASTKQEIDDFSANIYSVTNNLEQDISVNNTYSFNLNNRVSNVQTSLQNQITTINTGIENITSDISNINFILLEDISTNLNTLIGNNVVDRIDISNLKSDVIQLETDVSNHYDHFTIVTGDISSNLDGLVVQTTQDISSLNVLLSDLSDTRLVSIETNVSTNNSIIGDLSNVTYTFITDTSANMNVLFSRITDLSINTAFDISTIQLDISDRIDVSLNDISTFIQDLSTSTDVTFSNTNQQIHDFSANIYSVANQLEQDISINNNLIIDVSSRLFQIFSTEISNNIAHIDDLSSNINDLSNVLTQTISSVNQNQTSINHLDTKVNTIKYNTDLSINDIYNDLSANVTSILDEYLTSNPINVDISLTATDISNVKLIGDISADLYSLYLDVSNINENITDLSLSIATIQSDICGSLLNDISNSITNISTTVVNEAIIDVSASIAGLEATVNLNTSRVLDLITITNDFSSNWTTSEASVRNDLQAYTNTKVETDISNILGSSADTIASLQTLAADIQGDLSFASVITGQINDLSSAIQNVTTTNVDFECVVKACSSVYVLKTTGVSVGSGCFITFDGTDLSNGYFMTAAHCLLDVFNNSLVYTKKEVYVVDPVTNDWISVPIERIFIDGVADIALIKTNIDFTAHTDCILRFASSLAKTGDTCYLCGNPGGMDEDSLSRGVVRDSHYVLTTSYYFADAIYISAPGIAGNSGSPILNDDGKIIGMFMFGHNGNETFNGGPNLTTLNNSFAVLKTEIDYKDKKYLGFNWTIPTPFSLANHYTYGRFPNKGVIVSSVDTTNSPFKNVLNTNDLLLSITIGTNTIDVGSMIDQRTPGILLYSNETSITIRYIRGTTENIATITLDKTYQDVDNSLDLPLIGAAPTSTLTAKID